MQSLRRKLARDLYIPELQTLVDYGDPVEVRGRKTLEILDFVSEVEEPWHHCILIPSRHWNPWIAMSEALWILAGRNDVAALKPYNQRISDYSDDGVSLYGAYGARMFHQIDPLIERLRKDPSDRRAILQIWDAQLQPSYYADLTTDSKDPPCNDMVMFKLRQNKLHMTVLNRSNDIHWGLFAVNLPTFGILQEYIAARLGVQMGTQTHFSNSLHVYIDEYHAKVITDRMLYRETEDMPKYPVHGMLFGDLTWVKSHEEFASACSVILEENIKSDDKPFEFPITYEHKQLFEFFDFTCKFLWAYQQRKFDADYFLNQWPAYADWIMSGKMLAQRIWK